MNPCKNSEDVLHSFSYTMCDSSMFVESSATPQLACSRDYSNLKHKMSFKYKVHRKALLARETSKTKASIASR